MSAGSICTAFCLSFYQTKVLNDNPSSEGFMIKKKFYVDTHLGSPIEMCVAEVVNEPASSDTHLLGDIVDLANAAYSDLPKYEALHTSLKMKHGENYFDGNHERCDKVNEVIVETNSHSDRWLFAHGDLEANPTKWEAYRQKSHGAGAFKRKFIIPFIAEAEKVINRADMKPDFLERVYQLCQTHSANHYVCGHFHPPRMIVTVYKGITVIVLPRGCTILDLDQVYGA